MPILNYQTQPDGVLIESDRGWLTLTVYSSRAIRVRYTERFEHSNQPSLMVIAQPAGYVHFEVRETAGSLIFSTPDLIIEIDRQTLAYTYSDAE